MSRSQYVIPCFAQRRAGVDGLGDRDIALRRSSWVQIFLQSRQSPRTSAKPRLNFRQAQRPEHRPKRKMKTTIITGNSLGKFVAALLLSTFAVSIALAPLRADTLANISTRLRVDTGDNVLIGGFVITGTQPKKVIVRAIGPSLPLAGKLANPTLELRDGSGTLIRANDDWRTDQQAEIIATGIPPANDLESAIVATLPANGAGYTAIVRGVNNGTGIAVVEAYDLDQSVDSKLANISTRGFVQTGDNILIGGLIVLGQNPLRVIVRAIGPSLPVPGALGDPALELRDGNGALVASNDNWR